MAAKAEEPKELPDPSSSVIENHPALLASHREIYRFLFENRENPPTMSAIRDEVSMKLGPQTQTDRRVRDLYQHFRIDKVRLQYVRSPGYLLVAMLHTPRRAAGSGISAKTRAQVLAPQRCAQCGRSPLADHVRLVVDHKLPQAWGGSDDLDNLQPLCEECNGGKQAWFATFSEDSESIRAATRYDETHKRIGELLRAFKGEWVQSDLIAIVASAGAFQEDWQKRLRELRTIGWQIESRRERAKSGSRRVVTYYRATEAPAWPAGRVRAAITAAEHARRNDAAGESPS